MENYNAFASAVKEMGGSENTTYLEQMNELLSKDSDAYEKSVLHLQKTVHWHWMKRYLTVHPYKI